MGLAPAPHLGLTSAEVAEAEARKQRVLGRRPSTLPLGSTRTSPPPVAPEPHASSSTGSSPPHASDGKLPSESGWEVYDEANPKERVVTEVIEAAPTTARMIKAAAPERPAMAVAALAPSAPAGERRSLPEAQLERAPSAPPAIATAPTALALRPYEPSYGKSALSGPLDPRLALLVEPHSGRAASFRVLRDALLAKSLPRVIAVSSAAPRDGKTTCAVNLALALAEQPSTRVLLVDANFFEPELAKVFEVERLAPAAPPESALWLAPYKLVEVTPNLHVAAVMRAPGEVVNFEQHRFDAMIDRLCRVAYDYIVIDAPALRGTPSVIQLLTIADGTILAVRAGGTTATDLRRAAEQIPPNKALGLALIDANPGP